MTGKDTAQMEVNCSHIYSVQDIRPDYLGRLSKTTWRIFSVKGKGFWAGWYPAFPLKDFWQNDFLLKWWGEGGVPP